MAKYSREFLVPYLQNVCALHLAEQKVNKQHFYNSAYKKRLERGYYDSPKPKKPTRGGEFIFEFGGICGVIGLVVCFFFNLSDYDWFSKLLINFFVGLPTLAAALIGMISYIKSEKDYKRESKRYHNDLEEYNRIQQLNKNQASSNLPLINADLQKCELESRKIRSTLQKVYNVNIIPSRYRNIYVAVYLYDWFSTSQADDLDMALNMFVLEEIKEKLDRIIENQMDIILNQRLMIANQQRSLEQQQRHSNMMRAKLNQIAASNEERNIYLSMIESNTAATAYFAAADYIRKI